MRAPIIVAESLGIDIGPGVPQRKWAKSATQKKRLKAAAARTARLKKLRRQVGGRISKIANQLIPAVISHGASVVGINEARLKEAKQMAASLTTPSVSGRCLNMTLYLASSPIELALASAPLIRWHEEVW